MAPQRGIASLHRADTAIATSLQKAASTATSPARYSRRSISDKTGSDGGLEGALPLDAFDVCAANPAREHVAEPDAALKLVEELSNGQALRKIKLSNKSYGESREGHRREAS